MITQAASHPVTLEALRSRHGESYKWIVLATVMVGMMASALSARGIPQAASVISFPRQLGGAIGVSFIGTMLVWRLAGHDGTGAHAGCLGAFGECFLALAVIVAVAAGASWFMKPRSSA